MTPDRRRRPTHRRLASWLRGTCDGRPGGVTRPRSPETVNSPYAGQPAARYLQWPSGRGRMTHDRRRLSSHRWRPAYHAVPAAAGTRDPQSPEAVTHCPPASRPRGACNQRAAVASESFTRAEHASPDHRRPTLVAGSTWIKPGPGPRPGRTRLGPCTPTSRRADPGQHPPPPCQSVQSTDASGPGHGSRGPGHAGQRPPARAGCPSLSRFCRGAPVTPRNVIPCSTLLEGPLRSAGSFHCCVCPLRCFSSPVAASLATPLPHPLFLLL